MPRRRSTGKPAVQDAPEHCRLEAMTHVLRITALACAAVLTAAAADNQLTAQEKSAGWRLMFDGKTYGGWEDPARKVPPDNGFTIDRKSTRLNSSHLGISYAVFCL